MSLLRTLFCRQDFQRIFKYSVVVIPVCVLTLFNKQIAVWIGALILLLGAYNGVKYYFDKSVDDYNRQLYKYKFGGCIMGLVFLFLLWLSSFLAWSLLALTIVAALFTGYKGWFDPDVQEFSGVQAFINMFIPKK